MLDDGQWHTLEEIQQEMRLNESQIQQILTFLKEYNFIIIDEIRSKIKLEEKVQRFFTRSITS